MSDQTFAEMVSELEEIIATIPYPRDDDWRGIQHKKLLDILTALREQQAALQLADKLDVSGGGVLAMRRAAASALERWSLP